MPSWSDISTLLASLFNKLGFWVFVPGILVPLAFVIWSPDETATQYGFFVIRRDYRGWFFLAFVLFASLFVFMCIAQAVPGIQDRLYERGKRAEIRQLLKAAMFEEVAVLFLLRVSYQRTFVASESSMVARKLAVTHLVDFSRREIMGRTAYSIPDRVWSVLDEFRSEWQQQIEKAGFPDAEALHPKVLQLLHPPQHD